MPAKIEIAREQLLYESSRALIYRSDRVIQGKSVILKTLKTSHHNPEELAWFRREYEITSNLKIAGALKAYDFWDDRDNPTIVLEDFGGESLAQLSLAGQLSIGEFLELAIAIADCLSQVHEAGIIHKDINLGNIVLNPHTREVKIIDFGIATTRSREFATFSNANTLEGTLAYISPEQTGRMNRAIDARSDLYSLGVTFYALLSGRLPFQQNDPVELIHAHIAKTPPVLQISPAPFNQGDRTPQIIADIVMKLMAKNAEDRYQSAYGLKADLECCRQQWQEKQQIEPFALGNNDRGDRLQIPQKLYGRDREIATLLAAFEGVIRHQQPALCLVKGYSGIGKSALVAEIHKPITARRGFFVSGKFDRLHRDIPYSAIASALSTLLRQLLAEPETELQRWRNILQEAVGNNGGVIAEIVPELELILGKQSETSQLGAKESQNRFNLTLQNFLRAFTKIDHPLVLFLDDLQWADAGSLGLLHLLTTSPDIGAFCLIGAYRDNEVRGAHPLMLKVNKICSSGVKVDEIALEPLPLPEITKFLGDTLLCSPELTLPLAELLLEKTDGNPFFLNEFLKALYTEELLNFSAREQRWYWDISRIRDRDMTENVVELLAGKIQKLPVAALEMVKLAACIGNEFDLSVLGGISRVSSLDFAVALQWAIAEGVLIPLDQNYKLMEAKITTRASLRFKFTHDRIQQAAYSLFSDKEKQQLHLQIGLLLLHQTPSEVREDKVFDIVHHLNRVRQEIVERSKKDELARLNLLAGKKAKVSAAWQAALNYLQIALELLPHQSWKTQYEFTWELHVETIEAAYLCTEFDLLDELVETTLKYTPAILKQVRVYETKISALVARDRGEEAISTALEIAALLGIKFPKKATKLKILLNLTKTNILLARTPFQDLIALPSMKDSSTQAVMEILSSIIPLTYRWNPQLFPLITLKMVRLSLMQGNTPLSAFAYACYAIILCGVLGEIERGYQFGQLALQVWSRFNIRAHKAKILMPVALFTIHWKRHLKESLNLLLEGHQMALDTGDLEFASISAFEYIVASYWMGKTLSILKQDIETYGRSIYQCKQAKITYLYEQYKQIISQLTTPLQKTNFLQNVSSLSETELEAQRRTEDKVSYFYSLTNKLVLLYIFTEYSRANQCVEEATHYLSTVISAPMFASFHFYASLIWLEIYPNVSQSEQKHLLKKVSAYQNKMKQWARHAPMNYLHKYNLVEAERYRILGDNEKAADFYDRAIAGAKENEYIHEEGLANELAGKFYLARNKEAIARVYIHQAYRCYEHWGAIAKTQHLAQTYPQFFRSSSSQKSPITATILVRTTPNSTTTDRIDFSSVLKASQAIGEEILLDKLLARMMQIILENAAAQRGVLLLDRGGTWQMEAEITLKPDRVQVLQSQPLEQIPAFSLPKSAIAYILRTCEPLVLENAAKGSNFEGDEYFTIAQPQSLLCMPLVQQGKLMGLLYLEHSSSTGVFSPDRLEVLQILTAQAAIALENSLLYSNLAIANRELAQYNMTLEQKVQRRTEQLHEKNLDLEKTLADLQKTQAQLIHAEKMSGIGQMVAGIAHEINNPVSFIYSNLKPARTYIQGLFYLLNLYRQNYPQPPEEIQDTEENIELEFVAEDLPKILDSMQTGSQRIKTIVEGLRVFSRLDEAEYKTIDDLHANIESTLMLLQHHLRQTTEHQEIAIIKEYGKLPPVTCYASQLNQVFFNLLSNAIDALRSGDRTSSDSPVIRIHTEAVEGKAIRIAIADNGCGMDEATRQKVFEPFFTTKPIGSGTGLGLSTSYEIITEHHKGEIYCQSQLGKRTEVTLKIPVR